MRSPWTIKNEKHLEEEEEEDDEEEAGMAALPPAARSTFTVRRLAAITLGLTACILALLTAHVFFTPAPVACPACSTVDSAETPTSLTAIAVPPVVCPTVPAAVAPAAPVAVPATPTPPVPVDPWSYAGLMGEDPTSGAALRDQLLSDRDSFFAYMHESQFPTNCDTRKLYVLNLGHDAGLGSQLAVYQNHFLRALRLDRTLVINYKTPYGAGVCDDENWDCFFQPITSCKAPATLDPADQALPAGERRVLVDSELVWVFPDESQEVEFWNDREAPDPLYKYFRPLPASPLSAGALPRGNVFYFSEALRFLMRPNKLLLDTLKEVQSEPSMAAGAVAWNAPKTHLLSVHIRHGDNDLAVHQASEFGVRIRRQLQDYNQPVVFVGSDDNDAIQDVKNMLAAKRLTPPIVCHLAPEHFGVAGTANALSTLRQREGLYLLVQYFYFARAHSLIDGIASNSGRVLYQMRMWRRHEPHLVEHPLVDMDGDMWSTAGGWEVDSWKATYSPRHGAPKVAPEPVPKRREV